MPCMSHSRQTRIKKQQQQQQQQQQRGAGGHKYHAERKENLILFFNNYMTWLQKNKYREIIFSFFKGGGR